MSTPIRPSDQDLRALAAIVSQDRPDLPAGEGLPPSLLADLMGQIRCDAVGFSGFDSGRQQIWFSQRIQDDDCGEELDPAPSQAWWELYRECTFCTYSDRSGDLRSVVKNADFYSAPLWHATGMYTDVCRPQGFEHVLLLYLPEPPGRVTGPGRTVRLYCYRGSGLDFSERDRALLVLLRPHLYQAYLDVERRHHPVPRLTPRQNDLLRLLATGRTNTQIARRLGISEGTVRTHLENIYEKLGVSSRAAAVTRALADRVV
jgi:DNA-binding CsgD family transcriptional regulator